MDPVRMRIRFREERSESEGEMPRDSRRDARAICYCRD
jgi:hypothetical protein